MKIGRLRNVYGFWRSLSFVGNECKMRNTLMEYLQEEGLKCNLEDGIVIFKYGEYHFSTCFQLHDGFAECEINYLSKAEDYESLDVQNKMFIADKVNTEMVNHCKVLAFYDSLRIETSFYFSNECMMINLFSLHLEELIESLNLAMDIVCEKININKVSKKRRIGFTSELYKNDETEPERFRAVRRDSC